MTTIFSLEAERWFVCAVRKHALTQTWRHKSATLALSLMYGRGLGPHLNFFFLSNSENKVKILGKKFKCGPNPFLQSCDDLMGSVWTTIYVHQHNTHTHTHAKPSKHMVSNGANIINQSIVEVLGPVRTVCVYVCVALSKEYRTH